VARGGKAIGPNLLDLFGWRIIGVERKVEENSVLFVVRLLGLLGRMQGSVDCGGEEWA
jgi:hypothetical protein